MTNWQTIAGRELQREARFEARMSKSKQVPLFETGVKDRSARKGYEYLRPVRCRICGKRFRRQSANHAFMHHTRLGRPVVCPSITAERWEFTVAAAYLKYLVTLERA